MNWFSPGLITFYFCIVVFIGTIVSILPVIANLRKINEHVSRLGEAPVFLRLPGAQRDARRLQLSVASLPAYKARVQVALAGVRNALAAITLREAWRSVSDAITDLRRLIGELR
ncbi:MAG: hypothetical protein M3Z14_04835 [Candidatus Eremiobacteraeota bacterium]|nr:hypothetical protein [Candidatus Eremiobacteraeota bacterium]